VIAGNQDDSMPTGGQAARTLRILLVEDDGLVRMSTADMLADMGHTVIEAGNAQDALAALDVQAVDVLMTDLGLPGMTGDRLALEAQTRCTGPLGIVFASGRDALPRRDGDGVLARAVFVMKPFSEHDIREALRKAAPI